MCIDQASQTLYLHGGWDGTNDLSDFWSYDIGNGVWSCICEDTSLVVSTTYGDNSVHEHFESEIIV